MTNEMIAKAKECKSAEELLALAKENGYELTAEEAKAKFSEIHSEGEISDDELDGAAGGACNQEKEYKEQIRLPAPYSCPNCKGEYVYRSSLVSGTHYECVACGTEFTLNMFKSNMI